MALVDEIKKIGVIGAGTMGRGIAQVFALYDYPVILVDTEEAILQKAVEKLKKFTDPDLWRKGSVEVTISLDTFLHKFTEPDLWRKVSSLIVTSTDPEKLKDCDLIVEAVFEDISVKKEVLKSINSVCRK